MTEAVGVSSSRTTSGGSPSSATRRRCSDRGAGFSNFAISFTIISVLAGCFTTYGQAWNNGGPIAISWGWPIICGLILLVAFSMSELVSAYPTAGGIYYWASTLGGPKWGWFTGWFNLVGLVGVVASVDYGCATFLNASFMLFGVDLGFANWGDTSHILTETFLLFIVILTLHALINIYSSPLVAMLNNVSVFWHVAGVAAIILVLVFVPDTHQSVDFVFTETINNSGFGEDMFWFYVLPLGFLLTMYTQTGYDASAHISEETHGAAKAAAQGVWRSVFWSGVGGWFVLLAITFAATDVDGINEGLGSSLAVFATAIPGGLGEVRRGDRDDRPAVLRHGLRHLVLAHDVRVLARPRGAGLADLDAAEPPPRARLRRHRLLRRRRADDRAGAHRRRGRRTVRVLRGRLDLRDRPLHRLRDPGLPALADGRRVRARAVDARPPLPLGQPGGGDLGRHLRDHLLPAVHARRRAVA